MKELLTRQRDTAQRLGTTEVKETARKNYGTVKPSAGLWPVSVPFYDQTNNYWVEWDGTRWLTVAEYALTLTPFFINPLPFSGAGPSTILLAPIRTDYRVWYTHFNYYIFVNTTNNASNFWGITVTDSGATGLWSPSTAAAAIGQSTGDTTAAVAGGAGALFVNAQLTKSGSPGAVSAFHVTAYFRLIVT